MTPKFYTKNAMENKEYRGIAKIIVKECHSEFLRIRVRGTLENLSLSKFTKEKEKGYI